MPAGPPVCKKCRYNLAALPADSLGLVQCPECSLVQKPSPRRAKARFFIPPIVVGGTLSALVWLGIAVSDDGYAQLALLLLGAPVTIVVTTVLGGVASSIRFKPELADLTGRQLWKPLLWVPLLCGLAGGLVCFFGSGVMLRFFGKGAC